ncbi:hypothetical protein [Chryseobacterium salivictor]|uniref:Acetyltransferase (GNAT) domain-containing protein n=1 Tax=Chryseobacterium salivictor TaxID=2547600 RepID=A0A4P6ZHB4_9FLAO|nr:hypothetical protein [Chryseobacterium salivictor]QBO59150.1 hypothetical protein NBC122_02345 [Chryseobacterium salivictor]
MIKKIRYGDIDFEKYNECIESSIQKNFYANKFIMDHLCAEWEILVYGNYDYLMPIPIKKKMGIPVVVAPIFCQQIGIFSKAENQSINDLFLTYLKNNYLVSYYPFNYYNLFGKATVSKKNYIIEKQDYELLRKSYSKGRKAILAKSAEGLVCEKVGYNNDIHNFLLTHFKGLDKTSDVINFLDFIKFLNDLSKLRVYAYFSENKIISVAVLTDENHELILLALVNDPNYQYLNGASYLIDDIIQHNIRLKKIDFMGGNVRGIEVFFKSFGAQLEPFAVIENTKWAMLKKWIKK